MMSWFVKSCFSEFPHIAISCSTGIQGCRSGIVGSWPSSMELLLIELLDEVAAAAMMSWFVKSCFSEFPQIVISCSN